MPMHGIIVLQMLVFIFNNYGEFLLIILLCVVIVLLEYFTDCSIRVARFCIMLFFRKMGVCYASPWICHSPYDSNIRES